MQRFANNQPIEFIRFFNRTLVSRHAEQTRFGRDNDVGPALARRLTQLPSRLASTAIPQTQSRFQTLSHGRGAANYHRLKKSDDARVLSQG